MSNIPELVKALRREAEEGRAAASTCLNGEAVEAFSTLSQLFAAAADCIESQDKRFTEHHDAWKANNAWHAARLEKCMAFITAISTNGQSVDENTWWCSSEMVDNAEKFLAE